MTSLIDITLQGLEKEAKEEMKEDEGEEVEERVELMRVEAANPVLPALSSALEVAYKPEVGRHLVATRDIAVGEVVCVEEATLVRLLPTPALASTCCHCFSAWSFTAMKFPPPVTIDPPWGPVFSAVSFQGQKG